jgi:hypothetical protein
MLCKTIDLSPTSICSSLRAVAGNKKPRIIEPFLAALILERWENGTLGNFPALSAKTSELRSPAKAGANA